MEIVTPAPQDVNVKYTTQSVTEAIESASAEIALEHPDSGDFHETFAIPDGKGDVAVLIGDVTGHGSAAAKKAQAIRDEAVAQLKTGATPLETVEAANAVSQTPDDRYATFFVAKVNGETGEIRYANAGHEHPSINMPTGESRSLETTGPPLGVVPAGSEMFEEKTTILADGASLVLTTDGVTEARIPGQEPPEFFGSSRVRRAIERLTSSSPLQIVHAIIFRLLAFTKSMINDDVVVMAISRRAPKFRQ